MLIVCINSKWKIPCSYFLTAELSAIQKTGVEIVSLTFDGAQSTISMSHMLGCKVNVPNLETSFIYYN